MLGKEGMKLGMKRFAPSKAPILSGIGVYVMDGVGILCSPDGPMSGSYW